jgi:hypothetical protein
MSARVQARYDQPDPLRADAKPISAEEAAKRIGDLFDVTPSVGHIRRKEVWGSYTSPSQQLRLRYGHDVSRLGHEIGHHLQYEVLDWAKVRGSVPADIKAELVAAGEALYGAKHPKAEVEGIAEYTLLRVAEGQTEAAKLFPKFHAYVNDALTRQPGLARKFEQATAIGRDFFDQGAIARMEQRIVKPAHDLPRNLQELRNTFMRQYVDPYEGFKALRKHIANPTRRPTSDPYAMSKFWAMKVPARVERFITDGIYDQIGANKLAPSLREAIAPVVNLGGKHLTRFDVWMKSRRNARGAQNLGERSPDETAAGRIVTRLEQQGIPPEYHQAKAALNQIHEVMLNRLVENGLIRQDEYDAMRQVWGDDYTPFAEILNELVPKASGDRYLVWAGKGVNRRRVNNEPLLDIVSAEILNMARIERAIAHRQIAQSLLNIAEEPGMGRWFNELPTEYRRRFADFDQVMKQILQRKKDEGMDEAELDTLKQILEAGDKSFFTIWVANREVPMKENVFAIPEPTTGKVRMFQVNDPELFRTIQESPAQNMPILPVIGALARLKRLGITSLDAGFQLFNIIRDSMTYGIYTEGSFKGFIPRAIRGYVEAVIGGPWRDRFERFGGSMATYHGNDVTRLQLARDAALRSTKLRKALGIFRHPLDFYGHLLGRTEGGPRIAEMKLVYEKTKADPKFSKWSEYDHLINAMNAGQDVTLNFSQISQSMRWLNQVYAYSNAGVLGGQKLLGEFKNNPKRILTRGSALTAMSLGYWAAVHDEKWWKDQPMWLKYGFITFPTPLGLARIPLPFELGTIFWSIPVATMEALLGQGKEGELLAAVNNGLEQMLPAGVPTPNNPWRWLSDMTGAGPFIEAFANWDAWRKRPIVPEHIAEFPPAEQYNEHTTELAKLIGKVTGVSPMQLESLVDKLTGGLLMDPATLMDKARKGNIEMPDLPAIGRFFVREGSATRFQADFFKRRSELQSLVAAHGLGGVARTNPDAYRDSRIIERWYTERIGPLLKKAREVSDPHTAERYRKMARDYMEKAVLQTEGN